MSPRSHGNSEEIIENIYFLNKSRIQGYLEDPLRKFKFLRGTFLDLQNPALLCPIFNVGPFGLFCPEVKKQKKFAYKQSTGGTKMSVIYTLEISEGHFLTKDY